VPYSLTEYSYLETLCSPERAKDMRMLLRRDPESLEVPAIRLAHNGLEYRVNAITTRRMGTAIEKTVQLEELPRPSLKRLTREAVNAVLKWCGFARLPFEVRGVNFRVVASTDAQRLYIEAEHYEWAHGTRTTLEEAAFELTELTAMRIVANQPGKVTTSEGYLSLLAKAYEATTFNIPEADYVRRTSEAGGIY
jgi:hypothetical protein